MEDTGGQGKRSSGRTQCGHGGDKKRLDTQSDVGTLKPPSSGNKIYYDGKVIGLGLRVTAAGKRAFILNYRNKYGRERRMTIGRHPDWNLAGARTEAKALLQAIDKGNDPLEERKENRTAPTVADLCERYIAEHLHTKRASSAKEDRAMINGRILPQMKHMKVGAVEYADIDGLHKKITREGKPYRANRVLALLNKMFSLAVRWKMRSDNPCKGVARNQEEPRERFLTKDELSRIVRALAEFDDKEAANAIMLALLTGARRGEVLKASWDQFDLAEGVWTKPSAHTKRKKAHRVPLSAHALQLLQAMHAAAPSDATHLFANCIRLDGRVDIRRPWERLCEAAGVEGLRFHDLRHSYASLLASSGLSLPIIGSLLGHTQAQTTQRYAHLLDDPLRDATEVVGQMVARQ